MPITKTSPRNEPTKKNLYWDQFKQSLLSQSSKTRKSLQNSEIQTKEGKINDDIVQNHLLNKKSDIKDMVLTPNTISKIVDLSKQFLPEEKSKKKRESLDNRISGRIKEIMAIKIPRKIRRSQLNKGYDFSKTDIELKRSNSEKTKKVDLSSLEVKIFYLFFFFRN